MKQDLIVSGKGFTARRLGKAKPLPNNLAIVKASTNCKHYDWFVSELTTLYNAYGNIQSPNPNYFYVTTKPAICKFKLITTGKEVEADLGPLEIGFVLDYWYDSYGKKSTKRPTIDCLYADNLAWDRFIFAKALKIRYPYMFEYWKKHYPELFKQSMRNYPYKKYTYPHFMHPVSINRKYIGNWLCFGTGIPILGRLRKRHDLAAAVDLAYALVCSLGKGTDYSETDFINGLVTYYCRVCDTQGTDKRVSTCMLCNRLTCETCSMYNCKCGRYLCPMCRESLESQYSYIIRGGGIPRPRQCRCGIEIPISLYGKEKKPKPKPKPKPKLAKKARKVKRKNKEEKTGWAEDRATNNNRTGWAS